MDIEETKDLKDVEVQRPPLRCELPYGLRITVTCGERDDACVVLHRSELETAFHRSSDKDAALKVQIATAAFESLLASLPPDVYGYLSSNMGDKAMKHAVAVMNERLSQTEDSQWSPVGVNWSYSGVSRNPRSAF